MANQIQEQTHKKNHPPLQSRLHLEMQGWFNIWKSGNTHNTLRTQTERKKIHDHLIRC